MQPAPESKLNSQRRIGPALLSRFALVGVAATLLYAALALLFSRWMAPVQASLAAYTVAAVFSYLGHKFVTFVSGGEHRTEAPRFAVVTALGFAIAAALPALLSGGLGLPNYVPVLLTCLFVPLINLFVLDRWVFVSR